MYFISLLLEENVTKHLDITGMAEMSLEESKECLYHEDFCLQESLFTYKM